MNHDWSTTLTGHWFSALQSLHKQIKTRCSNGGMDNLWYAPVSGGVKHCGNSRVNDWSHLGTSLLVTNMCSLNAQQMLRLPQARYFRQSQLKLLFSLDWNSIWIPPGFKHTPWLKFLSIRLHKWKRARAAIHHPSCCLFCVFVATRTDIPEVIFHPVMVKFWIIDAGLYPPRWGKDQWPFSEKHQRCYCSKCPESFQQGNIQTDDGLRQVYVSQMSQVM